jgi:hypothetical protein
MKFSIQSKITNEKMSLTLRHNKNRIESNSTKQSENSNPNLLKSTNKIDIERYENYGCT